MKSMLKGGSRHVVDEGCLPLRWDGAILQDLDCKLYLFFLGELRSH